MPEKLTLTANITVSDFSLVSIFFHLRDSRIVVEVADTTGKVIACTYEGSTALALMVALNKANLSTTSLQRRILERLVQDNKLPAGNVTGSPD